MIDDLSRDDRGVTLIELLIAMAITAILGVLVMGTIFTIGKITTRIGQQTQDNVEVKGALDLITTNLRGATVDPSRPTHPQLAIATPGEVKFLTYGGRGFSEPPRWVHYAVRSGVIYEVDPQSGVEKPIAEGLINGNIFRYYKWDYAAPPDHHGNCFISLKTDELNTEKGRKSIVAVQVQLGRRTSTRFSLKDKHAGAWVRLDEQITPLDPVTGHDLDTWKNTCWETQIGRLAK